MANRQGGSPAADVAQLIQYSRIMRTPPSITADFKEHTVPLSMVMGAAATFGAAWYASQTPAPPAPVPPNIPPVGAGGVQPVVDPTLAGIPPPPGIPGIPGNVGNGVITPPLNQLPRVPAPMLPQTTPSVVALPSQRPSH